MFEDLIYDVGMNNGDDTAYYLHCGFRVVAIEANPALAAQAAKRFACAIAAGKLTIVNCGIAAEAGELAFWICETHTEWSSFDRSSASRDGCPHHSIEIPCRRFRSILEEYGIPFYLKVDIEGNDYLCLEDLKAVDLPKYASVEASDLELLRRLSDLGYRRFKCISQRNYLPLEIPLSREYRACERLQWYLGSRNLLLRIARLLGAGRWWRRRLHRTRSVNGWLFPFGSSGPFGEQTLGAWQSYEQMEETFQRFLDLNRAGEPSLFWNDAEDFFWSDFHVCKEG